MLTWTVDSQEDVRQVYEGVGDSGEEGACALRRGGRASLMIFSRLSSVGGTAVSGVGFLPLFKTCLRSLSIFDMISSTRMHRGRSQHG